MIELRKAKRYRLIRGPLRQKPPYITERERTITQHQIEHFRGMMCGGSIRREVERG